MTQRKLTIPVASETYDLLQQIAYENGQSLAAFCRDRIMAKENMNKAFSDLQSTLIAAINETNQQGTNTENRSSVAADNQAIFTEVLLLLRSLAPPQKVQVVHSELKRNGLEPFING